MYSTLLVFFEGGVRNRTFKKTRHQSRSALEPSRSSLALVFNLLCVKFAHRLLESIYLILALLHAVSVGHTSIDACRVQILKLLQDIVKHPLVLDEIVHVLHDLGISRLQIRLGLALASFLCGNGSL